MSRPALAAAVATASRALHDRGWVANHDGNVSARLGPDRFLVTPTAVSKAQVTEGGLAVVCGKGQVAEGELRPPSEVALHLLVYAVREDVGAVVHAHPPHATALACAGVALDRPFLAEAVVSLGPTVPLADFAPRWPRSSTPSSCGTTAS
jgi:L-fuculose-phosphate aldolase